jgi:hypothetical protein
MPNKPYSGFTTRAAHYSSRPSVPGVNPDHTHPDPEPDPFNPVPTPPPGATAGTVWSTDNPTHTAHSQETLITQGISHWYNGQPPVSSGVETANRMQAMQERMMVDHSDSNYIPDGIRLYQHFSEGMANLFTGGRPAQNAGVDPGENLQYLVNGTNSYDHTNEPNEVYVGAPENVGRYRLGLNLQMFGLYSNPIGKFGQDASLRAYTGLIPAFPVDKPPLSGTAPYMPNSVGTAHWAPAPPNQVPSMFALPAETAITDFTTAGTTYSGNSEFEDRGSF